MPSGGEGVQSGRYHSASRYDFGLAGAPYAFDDYELGERVGGFGGVTLEQVEHQMATRLYLNAAKVHSNALEKGVGRFGCRMVYGGS